MLLYNITIVILTLTNKKSEVTMNEDKIKQISDFWLSNKFLERFKAIGNRYINQLEEVENEKFRVNQKPVRISR